MNNDFLPIACAPHDRVIISRADDGEEMPVQHLTKYRHTLELVQESYNEDDFEVRTEEVSRKKTEVCWRGWVRTDRTIVGKEEPQFEPVNNLHEWRHIE